MKNQQSIEIGKVKIEYTISLIYIELLSYMSFKRQNNNTENKEVTQTTSDNGDQFTRLDHYLLEYFKYLREEINLRVTKHSYLVIYKLIAIGAMLAFIINLLDSPFEVKNWVIETKYLIWSVPLVSIVFDMTIIGNLRVVANIGIYIKENYEDKVFNNWKKMNKFPESFEFWESCGAHDKLMWKCYTPFDMMVIYSLTLFLISVPLITAIDLARNFPLNSYYQWNILIGSALLIISLKIYIDMCKLTCNEKSFIGVLKYLLGLKNSYLFIWDEIPGNDSVRLIDFLKQNYSIDWVKTATIEKIDNDRTIKVSIKKNSLSLKLNDEKTEVNLKIDDGKADKFIAKMENGKLNIYKNSRDK